MPARAFSVEDGNIGNTTVLTARTKFYSDLDLSFAKKGSGDRISTIIDIKIGSSRIKKHSQYIKNNKCVNRNLR